LLQYVDFNEYVKIIRRGDNWRDVFKEVFRDEEVISAKLKEIDPIRNAIAHGREISKEQFKSLELHVNDIIRSIRINERI
jgi:HEPN superfamily Swt1-like protein